MAVVGSGVACADLARGRECEAGAGLAHGRPTIAMATYVRLMVSGSVPVGLRTLVRGGLGLDPSAPVLSDRALERVPDESTVRKLTR